MPALGLNVVCTRPLRPCINSAAISATNRPEFALRRDVYLGNPTKDFSCRFTPRRLQTCTCNSHKEVDTDNSVSLGTRPGRAVVHRHALFNDFSITEPFGIVNAAAGIISLFFKGGWTSVLTIICGFILFTLGSMSHHNAVEGAESSWTHTLVSAVVCGVLAQKYYQKAIVGVAGTMVMTIVSALISLACVYNVVAGGNKPQSRASSNSPAPAASSPSQRLSDASSKPIAPFQAQDTVDSEGDSLQQAGVLQRGDSQSGVTPWGINAHTLVSVTGAVLYAQGLWGLWGETVGYSPAGLAAAAASGLAILGVARALVQRSAASQADTQ